MNDVRAEMLNSLEASSVYSTSRLHFYNFYYWFICSFPKTKAIFCLDLAHELSEQDGELPILLSFVFNLVSINTVEFLFEVILCKSEWPIWEAPGVLIYTIVGLYI